MVVFMDLSALSQAMLCSQELLINYSRGNIVIMVLEMMMVKVDARQTMTIVTVNKAYDGFSRDTKVF